MLSMLLIVFIFAAVAILFALAVVGVIIFRKKSTQTGSKIDSGNVIDVTPKDAQ